MNITEENTVAEIVTDNIKTSDVFKKYGIDFCCGGGISIKKVCEKHHISFDELKEDLLKINDSSPKSYDFKFDVTLRNALHSFQTSKDLDDFLLMRN